MKDKLIHLVGMGGVSAIGMTRCLKDHFKVQGHDDSEWAELMAECPAGEPWEADLIIPVPDAAVNSRYGTSDISFCPDRKQVELCQDKAACAKVLGGLAPKTFWVRDTHGAGGKGAQMASEYLPGKNYSVEFVFYKGKELAYFQKERISYLVKHKEENVTASGSSAVSVCRHNKNITTVARQAILRVAAETNTDAHGFYGVDLKENEDMEFKVTEINAGRLLTASYSYYWLTGYNLPLVGVNAYFGLPAPVLPPYPTGYGVIRQTDCLPKLVEPKITRTWK